MGAPETSQLRARSRLRYKALRPSQRAPSPSTISSSDPSDPSPQILDTGHDHGHPTTADSPPGRVVAARPTNRPELRVAAVRETRHSLSAEGSTSHRKTCSRPLPRRRERCYLQWAATASITGLLRNEGHRETGEARAASPAC